MCNEHVAACASAVTAVAQALAILAECPDCCDKHRDSVAADLCAMVCHLKGHVCEECPAETPKP